MRVHTIDELQLTAPPGKRLVVLGDPVSHSLSPAMHNAALWEMSKQNSELADWAYEAVHVKANCLGEALERLHAAGVAGINLTIPHKVIALELVESIDEAVRPMGAVNTLIRTQSGYRATNTDGYGILKALQEAFAIDVRGRDVWLFGAGGAARGIVVACSQAGCERLTVVNRSEPRLRELEVQVASSGMMDSKQFRFFPSATAPVDMSSGSILINATSLGLKVSDPSPIPDDFLKAGGCVYDTTYGVSNQLGRNCAARGVPYADGLTMLVWQGVRSLEIWTGQSVPAAVMREAAEGQLRKRNSNG